MKVIQVVDNLGADGGVNSFVYDLCYALKEQGCDVFLVGILKKGYAENTEIEKLRLAGICVECIGAASKKDAVAHCIGKLKTLIKEIAEDDFTICNLHLKLSVLMGVIATRGLKNVKCVETYHNTYHHYHLQCWACSPFIEKYICVSETAKEEMHQRFKIPYRKLVAIPNGVFRNRIRALAKIGTYHPKKDKIRIVSVGRLSYEKNFIVPIKAFVDLCTENLTYTIVGGGPQEEELRTIASMNRYITLTGALPREQALQLLATADIVVMPSLWEGRSILQLEAMALDKPMVLSDVPGLRETFHEKPLDSNELFRICDFGYLVKTSTPESYRAAILTFAEKCNIKDYTTIKRVSEQNDMAAVAVAYATEYRRIF